MSKITHEQAFEDLQKIVEVDQRVVGMYEVKYLRDYITQQEKQEKLLELYKEALETNFEGITLIKLVNITLRTQIKELENEGGNDHE